MVRAAEFLKIKPQDRIALFSPSAINPCVPEVRLNASPKQCSDGVEHEGFAESIWPCNKSSSVLQKAEDLLCFIYIDRTRLDQIPEALRIRECSHVSP